MISPWTKVTVIKIWSGLIWESSGTRNWLAMYWIRLITSGRGIFRLKYWTSLVLTYAGSEFKIKCGEFKSQWYFCDYFCVEDPKTEVTKYCLRASLVCKALGEIFELVVLPAWCCLMMVIQTLEGTIESCLWPMKTYRLAFIHRNSLLLNLASVTADRLPTHFARLLCSVFKVLTCCKGKGDS